MFIKLNVKFHCCVSVLHYNSISDIRYQESMNKFSISDVPSEYPFPTRELVLPILCSLTKKNNKFWMELRYWKCNPNFSKHSWQHQIHDKSGGFFYFSLSWTCRIIWNPATGSASNFLVRSLCRLEAGKGSEPPRLTGKKLVLQHGLEIKE